LIPSCSRSSTRPSQRRAWRASSLKLEITESVMMDNAELSAAILLDLKARHIDTCMDDFGTGYSSLSFLQQYAVDILKIDQSFMGLGTRECGHLTDYRDPGAQ